MGDGNIVVVAVPIDRCCLVRAATTTTYPSMHRSIHSIQCPAWEGTILGAHAQSQLCRRCCSSGLSFALPPPSLHPSVCRVVGLSVGLLPQCRRLGGQIFSSSIALFPRLIHSLARSLAPHASACCLAAYLSWDSVIVVVRHPVLCQCANHAASSSSLFASLQPSSCSSNRLLWSDVSSLHH